MTGSDRQEASDPPLVTFDAIIRKSAAKGGWTFVIWPQSADFFGTRGLVKVVGVMDGEPFRSAFMPLGDGTHKLPVTGLILKRIGKSVGDTISVSVDRRLA